MFLLHVLFLFELGNIMIFEQCLYFFHIFNELLHIYAS